MKTAAKALSVVLAAVALRWALTPTITNEDALCTMSGNGTCMDDVDADGIHRDIKQMCPLSSTPVRHVAQAVLGSMHKGEPLYRALGFWPKNASLEGWGDAYSAASYLLAARGSLSVYSTRDGSWVRVPVSRSDPTDVIRVENVHAPREDVDGSPNFLAIEKYMPGFLLDTFYVPALTCFYSALRRVGAEGNALNGKFDDALDHPWENTWEAVLNNTKFETKRDWVMDWYDDAKSWDGTPMWPMQMTDFRRDYFQQDEWNDQLEHAIAFHLIGAHRVQAGSFNLEKLPGVTLPFRVPLNAFAGLDVREHFGRYGADLYFNEDGLPIAIETPSGEVVMRGDRQWQYWKFVWRSTLITIITAVDHLHFTHFRASNILSRATRAALPPTSPLRRISSIFTFGGIFVNTQAMHTLIGPNHMLHRATPFKDLVKLSNLVPSALVTDVPELPELQPLMHEDAWEKLHPKLQEAPFYADGVLLMSAFRRLANKVADASYHHICLPDGNYHRDWQALLSEITVELQEGNYALNSSAFEAMRPEKSCREASARETFVRRLMAHFFVATGYHRHVGFVGDYYADPELATMSWKEGETSGRPRQHMIMTYINVFTSTRQPLLKDDFTHLFKGMVPDLESEFSTMWREFQNDLKDLEQEIDRRNKGRKIVNWNMSPKVVESAVSK